MRSAYLIGGPLKRMGVLPPHEHDKHVQECSDLDAADDALVTVAIEMQSTMAAMGDELDLVYQESKLGITDEARALFSLIPTVLSLLIGTREGRAIAKLKGIQLLGLETFGMVRDDWFQAGLQEILLEVDSDEAVNVEMAFSLLNDKIGRVTDEVGRWQVQIPALMVKEASVQFFSGLGNQLAELGRLLKALLEIIIKLSEGLADLSTGTLMIGAGVSVALGVAIALLFV